MCLPPHFLAHCPIRSKIIHTQIIKIIDTHTPHTGARVSLHAATTTHRPSNSKQHTDATAHNSTQQCYARPCHGCERAADTPHSGVNAEKANLAPVACRAQHHQ